MGQKIDGVSKNNPRRMNVLLSFRLVVSHFGASTDKGESRLLYELGFYLGNCGLSEPLHQVIYFSLSNLPYIFLFFHRFIWWLSQLPR